jgi:hypothetical protein
MENKRSRDGREPFETSKREDVKNKTKFSAIVITWVGFRKKKKTQQGTQAVRRLELGMELFFQTRGQFRGAYSAESTDRDLPHSLTLPGKPMQSGLNPNELFMLNHGLGGQEPHGAV